MEDSSALKMSLECADWLLALDAARNGESLLYWAFTAGAQAAGCSYSEARQLADQHGVLPEYLRLTD